MKVSLWAEIRRLSEVEGLSRRAIADRLRCGRRTVAKALAADEPPRAKGARRVVLGSVLDPYKAKIDALVAQCPELSAVRVAEEIAKGPDGYRGSVITVRRYVRTIRPTRGRVYQEVAWEPGQAMQVDWGHCGKLVVGQTTRDVSVLVAVLCYSRMCYVEFTLSQRKAEFYRAVAGALEFFQGSPKRIIFDNLKAAVVNGSGRTACLHPEFLALCGHFCLEPIACARRDPESKGIVEAGVRYVKRNALEGRAEELTCWADYQRLSVSWRDQVANVRIHAATRERPIDRFEQERPCLRKLPNVAFDSDEIVSAVVTSHGRIQFDGNRYSVPPALTRKPVTVRASAQQVRILYEGREVASHQRSYDRRQLISLPEHQLEALRLRRRDDRRQLEETFDALGPAAREFRLELHARPVKSSCHLRRLLGLVRLYGRGDVLTAMAQACQYKTYDAAYVETILLQHRRQRELPSPTPLRPKRRELLDQIDCDDPDPAIYDRLVDVDSSEQQEEQDNGQEQ